MLCHKTSISKFKRMEIIQNMFSNKNRIQSEIDGTTKLGKYTHTFWGKIRNTSK